MGFDEYEALEAANEPFLVDNDKVDDEAREIRKAFCYAGFSMSLFHGSWVRGSWVRGSWARSSSAFYYFILSFQDWGNTTKVMIDNS